ncbi:MAG: hypothetical protein ABI120_12615 [Gemmatimonadaceae bacterium]
MENLNVLIKRTFLLLNCGLSLSFALGCADRSLGVGPNPISVNGAGRRIMSNGEILDSARAQKARFQAMLIRARSIAHSGDSAVLWQLTGLGNAKATTVNLDSGTGNEWYYTENWNPLKGQVYSTSQSGSFEGGKFRASFSNSVFGNRVIIDADAVVSGRTSATGTSLTGEQFINGFYICMLSADNPLPCFSGSATDSVDVTLPDSIVCGTSALLTSTHQAWIDIPQIFSFGSFSVPALQGPKSNSTSAVPKVISSPTCQWPTPAFVMTYDTISVQHNSGTLIVPKSGTAVFESDWSHTMAPFSVVQWIWKVDDVTINPGGPSSAATWSGSPGQHTVSVTMITDQFLTQTASGTFVVTDSREGGSEVEGPSGYRCTRYRYEEQ